MARTLDIEIRGGGESFKVRTLTSLLEELLETLDVYAEFLPDPVRQRAAAARSLVEELRS